MRCRAVVAEATERLDDLDYAGARAEIEGFFWRDLADNYLEMAKSRLYAEGPASTAARQTLRSVVYVTLRLLAPFLPFVTDAAYGALFADDDPANPSPMSGA